jgi:hypothetical protein
MAHVPKNTLPRWRAFSLKPDGNGAYRIDLNKGEEVLLYGRAAAGTRGEPPRTALAPVPSEKQYENFYGSLKQRIERKSV